MKTEQLERLVSVENIRPTQVSIGMAHVDTKIKTINEFADLETGVRSRKVPGFVAPDGSVWISDGHHWSTAVQRLSDERKQMSPDAPPLELAVDIQQDFENGSWDDFVAYLQRQNVGYFEPEMKARYLGKENLDDLYRNELPKTLSAMKDSPARSVIGIALEDKIGILAEQTLVNYAEFYLAEDLRDVFLSKGLDFERMKSSSEINLNMIETAAQLLSTDSKAIELLTSTYLRLGVDPSWARRTNRQALQAYSSAHRPN